MKTVKLKKIMNVRYRLYMHDAEALVKVLMREVMLCWLHNQMYKETQLQFLQ